MKTIIFAAAGYNLAETTRMIEIAKACKDYFQIIFMSYGGRFEGMIEEEGFSIKKMEPRLTDGKLKYLDAKCRGDNPRGDWFTAEELEYRVAHEIDFYSEIKPAALLTGWCLSTIVSTRAANVPFVMVGDSTWIREYYEKGLQVWPDLNDYFFLRWISEKKLNHWVNQLMLTKPILVKPFNIIGKKYGVKKFNTFPELLEGDYTLLADIPEFSGLFNVRQNFHYIGPLIAKIKGDIPVEIVEIPKDKPIVYFAMGSSGKPKIISDIVSGFKDKPYRVITPIKSLIKGMNLTVPNNVIVTDFLPAHRVNPMADISVIHGGIGTVMTACLSGTPIVGVAMQAEQEANLDCCVRKGFAIRIKKKSVTASNVLEAVDRIIHDKTAKEEAKKFQKELINWDGPANAARFLCETFGN